MKPMGAIRNAAKDRISIPEKYGRDFSYHLYLVIANLHLGY
jgi:hypothetical protein